MSTTKEDDTEQPHFGIVNQYWQQKYRREASKNWNLFYKRNETRFFKDRHWIQREFPELFNLSMTKTILEVGCGVGNFAFPLAEAHPYLKIYACDFAPRAIELLKSHELYSTSQITAFVADLVEATSLTKYIIPGGIDVVTCIFVFSAIPPEKFIDAIQNIKTVLRPGGMILFRDYAYDDAAQKRFKVDRQLGDSMFVRQDGTLAYYFKPIELQELFIAAGFDCQSCDLIHGRTSNLKKEIDVERLFLQAKFILNIKVS